MCRKDSRDIDMPLAAEGDRNTSLPFVEVCDDGRMKLARNVLSRSRASVYIRWESGPRCAYLAQEPCNEITKNYGFVSFSVVRRRRDPSQVPEVALPFVEAVELGASVEEQDVRVAFD